jgi:hypothetical protein
MNMNVVKSLEQFNENNVYFCEPIKNNVMNDGNFFRIFYSNHLFTLNGIYLLIPFNDFYLEKYYNKYKCNFNGNAYMETINKIKQIEELILSKIEIKNKLAQYKIYGQLKCNYVKVFQEKQINPGSNLILKISGIWENATHYGITYKFMCGSMNKIHLHKNNLIY